MIEPIRFNLLVGWTIIVSGAVSGAGIGLFFHQENWMGGYASLRRRMTRLGHISFFSLGIINGLFALRLNAMPITLPCARFGSAGFAIGAVTMPACCFLSAGRPAVRDLVPVPVVALLCAL